ncbi:MAG: HD domain-containing protein [Anaerolineae bacterium]
MRTARDIPIAVKEIVAELDPQWLGGVEIRQVLEVAGRAELYVRLKRAREGAGRGTRVFCMKGDFGEDPDDATPMSPAEAAIWLPTGRVMGPVELWNDIPVVPDVLERFGALIDCELFRGRAAVLGEALYVLFRSELLNRFLVWPASRNHHHAFRGGLLLHTVEVGESAIETAKRVGLSEERTAVVLMSALVHDIGKLDQYEVTLGSGGRRQTVLTERGKLVGHIALGWRVIADVLDLVEAPEDLVLAVEHCVLSHHGKKEWGSPVEPGTPEAEIVHEADMSSCWAKMAA